MHRPPPWIVVAGDGAYQGADRALYGQGWHPSPWWFPPGKDRQPGGILGRFAQKIAPPPAIWARYHNRCFIKGQQPLKKVKLLDAPALALTLGGLRSCSLNLCLWTRCLRWSAVAICPAAAMAGIAGRFVLHIPCRWRKSCLPPRGTPCR